MKSDESSLFSRFASLFSNGKDHKNGSKELKRLYSEQIRLSAELEGLLASYDERTRQLSRRLMASRDTSLSVQELAELDVEQQVLWRMVRRLQAADRTVSQLEREYAEWRERPDCGISSLHADHPKLRAELIASELRVRGRDIPGIEKTCVCEGSAKDVDPFSDLCLSEDADVLDERPAFFDDPLPEPSRIPLSSEIHDALLEEIRECGRQLRKQSADPNASPEELAGLYRDLRHQHELLRHADRRAGIRRYRVGLHEG
jgi:hypothetical protein